MRERRAFYVVFAIAAALVVPAAIALRAVIHPVILQPSSDNPTPLGYTWSLLLFIIPIAALGWWFACRPDLQFPRKAFWRTIVVLTPLGFLLDLLFGNTFFIFPNKAATLGCDIPALGGAIPIEEFIFYLTGFTLVLLSYIWCDEYWMAAYNVPDYTVAAKGISRIVRFHFASVVLGVGLIAAAVLYRKFLSGASGFTFFLLLLISLLWEVTLALPYGWWEYRPGILMGLNIGAWFGLPIEAVCVWLAVSFTTIITYEVIKIWKALGTRALEAFFGIRK